jgi:radical SAM protein with 4Fe4S-binding SPASM domain
MREILDAIKKRPRCCVWELTAQCNMRCRHCGSDLDALRKRGEDLTLDESRNLCEELFSLGCEHVALSGGEPLLSAHWEAIATQLTGQGIFVSLISNGYLLSNRVAQTIKAAGIRLVGLSLDGLETTHNYIRRNDHSFAKVCEAIDHCKASALEVCVITHIHRSNLAELRSLEDLVAGRGADVWQIQLGIPIGQLAKNRELLILPSDLPALADYLVAAQRRHKISIAVADSIGYYSGHERDLRRAPGRGEWDFWCGCSAGCLNLGIEHNGNVLGCLSLQADEFVEGNVRRESLTTIWRKKGNFSYTRDFDAQKLSGACAGCEYGEVCRGGCTAVAFGATGAPHNNPYCLHAVLSERKNVPDFSRP